MNEVTVVIPTRRLDMVKTALASLKWQRFRDFSVIVSIRSGRGRYSLLSEQVKKLRQYLDGTGQAYLLEQPGDIDKPLWATCRNTALEHISSRFTAFLDDDDIWLPDYLWNAYHAFTRSEYLGNRFVVSSFYKIKGEQRKNLIYEEGKTLSSMFETALQAAGFPQSGYEPFFSMMKMLNPMTLSGGSNLFAETELFRQIPFDKLDDERNGGEMVGEDLRMVQKWLFAGYTPIWNRFPATVAVMNYWGENFVAVGIPDEHVKIGRLS